MKFFLNISLCITTILLLLTTILTSHNTAKAGDFSGKKVLLKQDCKSNPDYCCHLRGDNLPNY